MLIKKTAIQNVVNWNWREANRTLKYTRKQRRRSSQKIKFKGDLGCTGINKVHPNGRRCTKSPKGQTDQKAENKVLLLAGKGLK